VKCSNHFGAKRRGLLKVIIVLASKGAIQNYIKNIRYDNSLVSGTRFFIHDLFILFVFQFNPFS
jgi:hypothetical protein